jgi:hypothetical protein
MKTAAVVMALLMVGVPSVSSAQEGGQVKTKFYNFDDLLIDGQYKKPQVLYTDARQKVKFERLLKLKKDFLPKLKATAKDFSLR